MTLGEFGALWLVRKRLSLPGDDPEQDTGDRPIVVATPKDLAQALCDRVRGARLRTGAPNGDIVTLNAAKMAAASADWDTLFEVRDSVIASAECKNAPATAEQMKSAFGGFLVLRWVWEAEGGSKPAIYPDKNPPILGDEIEKRLLARILASRLNTAGIQFNVLKDFLGESKDWSRRYDPLTSVLKHTL